ncbi:MAG: hypothetical protein ACTHMP_05850, partial [Thermomicrobiales bacterium]
MMDPVSRLSVDEGHYWVYVLRCNDGSYYQGYSANLRRQLRAMALGISSKRVAEHLPLCLVGARPHSNREESAQSRDELKTCTDERLADIASEAGWYSGLDLRQALIGNNVGDLRLISTVWR